jgi:hypothetical protein
MSADRRVETIAVRPLRSAHGARARALQVSVLRLHPSLLRVVARGMVGQRAVPMISYEDVATAIEWLSRAFGFHEQGERFTDDDGRVTTRSSSWTARR